jgi:hypothetical protein
MNENLIKHDSEFQTIRSNNLMRNLTSSMDYEIVIRCHMIGAGPARCIAETLSCAVLWAASDMAGCAARCPARFVTSRLTTQRRANGNFSFFICTDFGGSSKAGFGPGDTSRSKPSFQVRVEKVADPENPPSSYEVS